MAFPIEFEDLLRLGTLTLHPLISVAGVVVCYWFRHLSSWLTILLIGFALEIVAVGMLGAQGLLHLVGVFDVSLTMASRVVGIVAAVLIVVGLAAVLNDLRQQLHRARGIDRATRTIVPPRPRVPEPDDPDRWLGQTPGRRDIRE